MNFVAIGELGLLDKQINKHRKMLNYRSQQVIINELRLTTFENIPIKYKENAYFLAM